MQLRTLVAVGAVGALGFTGVPALAASPSPGDTEHVVVAVAWENSDQAQKENSQQLSSRARELGFTVRPSADGESLDLSGPPSLIERTFRNHTTGELTTATLGSDASGVLDPTDRTPVFRALGLTGNALAGAYGATNPRQSVPTPSVSSDVPIVATVQFSDWNPASLTKFAQSNSIYADPAYDPVVSGQWTSHFITADGCHNGTNNFGALEVTLDQEAILSTAPTLRQRTYAANIPSTICVLYAYQAVLTDIQNGEPITTLSTSWGACEANLTNGGYINALDGILQQIVNAGVTITAATGDSGKDDCGDGSLASDFPASSTAVVAVGGTTHAGGAAQPNAANPDQAWNSFSGASGGGFSGAGLSSPGFQGFARPAWQTAQLGFPTVTKRLLPDVSLAADPNTGLLITVVGPECGGSGGPCTGSVGGTSLASPLFAAMLAQVAADHPGPLTRFGRVTPTLYAHPEAFVDVTTMTNASTPYTWAVGSGFDLATGLGTPNMSVLAQALFAVAPPISTPIVAPALAKPTSRAISVGKAVGVTAKSFSWIRTPQGLALSSARKGATTTIRFTGTGLELHFAAGPGAGRIRVTIDGRSQTFDLYSAKSMDRLTKFLHRHNGNHTAIITVLGSHSKLSKGSRVVLTFLRVRA